MPPDISWCFGPFRLEPTKGCLWRGTELVPLPPKPLAVLTYLVAHAGQVVTKAELLDAVWPEIAVTEGVLKTCLGQIRQVLDETAKMPMYIATMHRRGYRFFAPVVVVDAPLAAPGDPALGIPTLQKTATLSPIVVREAEMAQLNQRWMRALNGERQMVFLMGDAGVGKTTLVEAFVAQVTATADVWCGHGQCIDHYGAGEAYLPLLEALGRLGRAPDGTRLVTLLQQSAPSWLLQLPTLFSPAEFEALQRRGSGATRDRMLRELADAVEILTAARPLVLVLEDLHWSDPSTLEWLTYVARRRDRARLLVLGTYRPLDAVIRSHPLRAVVQELRQHVQCAEVRLTYLSATQVATYLTQRFGAGLPVTELAQLLHQRTQGHPLFLVMVVDELVRCRVLVERNGAWMLQGNLTAVLGRVPDSVRQFIEYQIEKINVEEQILLEVASIVGAEFSTAAVAAGVDQTADDIEIRCTALAHHGQFIQALGLKAWPDGTVTACYGFTHTLYQDVLSARVSPGHARRLHQQIGARKEIGYGVQAHEIAAELAIHFEYGQDIRRAVQYCCQAGATALQRSAHQEAIAHVKKGLELLQDGPDALEDRSLVLHLQAILGASLIATKGYAAPEVAEVYIQAYALCQQGEAYPQLCSILRGLRLFYAVRAEFQTAQTLEEQLLELAQRQEDLASLVLAHSQRGETLLFLGMLPEARAHAEAGLALVSQQPFHPSLWFAVGQDPEIVCLSRLSWVLWALGFVDQALARSRTTLLRAQELAHPLTLAGALGYTALLHQSRRDGQAAKACAEAVLALSAEQGFVYWFAYGMILRGCALAIQGYNEEAIAQMHQGLAQMQATGAEVGRPFFLAQLADTYRRSGQFEEGLRVVAEALTLVDCRGERGYEAELHRLRGELLLMAPREVQDEAETCFHRALDVARRQQAKSFELHAAMSLARLWQQQGKRAEAYDVLAPVYDWFTEGFDATSFQEAKVLLDTLAYTKTSRRFNGGQHADSKQRFLLFSRARTAPQSH